MEKIFYQTTDINVAATLLTLGKDVAGINPMNPNRVVFYFDIEKFPNIQDLVERYWSNKLLVNPKDLVSNRRELLTRVHESKRQLEENDKRDSIA